MVTLLVKNEAFRRNTLCLNYIFLESNAFISFLNLANQNSSIPHIA